PRRKAVALQEGAALSVAGNVKKPRRKAVAFTISHHRPAPSPHSQPSHATSAAQAARQTRVAASPPSPPARTTKGRAQYARRAQSPTLAPEIHQTTSRGHLCQLRSDRHSSPLQASQFPRKVALPRCA